MTARIRSHTHLTGAACTLTAPKAVASAAALAGLVPGGRGARSRSGPDLFITRVSPYRPDLRLAAVGQH